MSHFAVSYQLNLAKDYQSLWDEFARLGGHKVMNSFYFVDLNNTTAEVRDHLRQFIDEDDYLCVVKFSTKPSFSRALAGTNAWIDKRY